MNAPRFTQKDVARAAGVTQATVSMALSNHPAVASKTKAHVRKVASQLGYLPDPYLKGLAAYRKQRSVAKFQATIAWLSNWHKPETWKWQGVNCAYFAGASARAKELGYQLEEHALLSPGMTPRRMKQILFARNIQGIILPPQPRPGMSMDFCFDAFSVVTFGYTLASPHLHTIALHHYRSMETLVRELLALGYKRPGLALTISDDLRTDGIWSAAFWSEQKTLPPEHRVPILSVAELNATTVLDWIKQQRPDVVIGTEQKPCQWLLDSGMAVPEDIGFASLTASENDPFYAGIWQNLEDTGAKAVDFLINMIHTGERGIPKVRANLLIDGTWAAAKSVRRQS